MSEALIEVMKLQGGGCRAFGSPFSAALLERAADEIGRNAALDAAFAPWDGLGRRELFDQAVVLRWLGALHDLALERPDSPLAAAYPRAGRDRQAGNPGDAAAAWPAILQAMAAESVRIAAFMTHEPQTNEVRRSAVLLGGFLEIARVTGLPLAAVELGASAGLNQLWDQRRYRLGERLVWGPADGGVEIDCDWRGGAPPLEAAVRVAARSACDRKPIDLSDAIQRRRLTAYVWPDQFDRLTRLAAAIAQTLAAGVAVETCDAVCFAERSGQPQVGLATVVFHSVFFQYMPRSSQRALVKTLAAAGRQARRDAPLAWLRMEPDPNSVAAMELRLTLWPGGEERQLATAHPHGAWVEWRDP